MCGVKSALDSCAALIRVKSRPRYRNYLEPVFLSREIRKWSSPELRRSQSTLALWATARSISTSCWVVLSRRNSKSEVGSWKRSPIIPVTSYKYPGEGEWKGRAAKYFNRCRSKGIQGSNTDFLICAMANRNKFSIFTTDKDFELFSKHIEIILHKAA